MAAPIVTRFAPSPTGRLHLGHAYSAILAHDAACAAGGRFILRIEDIDHTRCKPEFIGGIYEDLAWLGLSWETPVRVQSEHRADYADALAKLETLGVLYPCFCTRKDIEEEIQRAGAAPHGPEGALYPGICRDLSESERADRIARGVPFSTRLNVAKARQITGELTWRDRAAGTVRAAPELLGDVVLARKDIGTSYHLAVTVDDALQGVTLITRGKDLFEATHAHRLLQALLELPEPAYFHHELLTDAEGRRFAKRDQSLTLQALRAAGETPESIRRRW